MGAREATKVREPAGSQAERLPAPGLFGSGIQVAGLASLAVSQPLFDLLAREPAFLVAHGLDRLDLLLGAALLGVALPLVCGGVLALAGAAAGKRATPLVYAVGVGGFTALMILPEAAKLLRQHLWGSALLAAVAGAVIALAAVAWSAARSFLAVLAVAVVVAPGWFLTRSSLVKLLCAPSVEVSGGVIDGAPPLVLVIFDEMPLASLLDSAGRIDAVRYPSFARLAGRSWWFRNATTVAEETVHAIPPILTGRYPDRPRLALAAEYPESLFTLLAPTYRLEVVESLTRLCPGELCERLEGPRRERWKVLVADTALVYLHATLPLGLSERLPSVSSGWRGFWQGRGGGRGTVRTGDADDVRAVWDRFLARLTGEGEPALHLIHLNLPHLPWRFLPSGQEYGPRSEPLRPHGLRGEEWEADDWAVLQGWQRHLLQLGFTDLLLGRLLDRLEAAGLFDEALLVVTADHGASFQPGLSRRVVVRGNAAEILRVPLFIKLPQQSRGEVSTRQAETIDILPTVAAALGADLPWPVDGRSLLSDGPRRPETRMVRVGEETIEVLRFGGDSLDLAAAVERKVEAFGRSTEPRAIYRIAPERPELLGAEVGDLRVGAATPFEALLRDPWELERVDPQAPYLPTHVSGALEPPPEGPVTLAVAVNGTVAALTRSYRSSSRRSAFTAMVPPTLWRRGANAVEVFLLRGDRSELARVPLAATSSYRLLEPGGAAALVGAGGRRVELVAGAVQGEVEREGAFFRGWAADLEAGRPAELVLFFVGDELISATVPEGFRPEVGREHGGGLLSSCGFEFRVPFAHAGGGEARFIALIEDRASELGG